ncbi:DMT family transporter [Alkalicoccus chagannorensis]|uniref:DMT family transporter n=1 Tax=Alkalicoccus chagannorensis TaxID=427072 RepID=UPI000416E1ED|nr:DMT family transporter [Alkalicoccus chagannorensis]
MRNASVYLLLMFVMMIWGLNVVAVKFLVEHMPPVQMQGLRISIAAVTALLIVWLLKEFKRIDKKMLFMIAGAALFGQTAHHSLLAVGLTDTTAANGSLILGLIPLTTAVLAVIFLGDPLTKFRLFGILLGFSGVTFIILSPEEGVGTVSRGDLLIFLSMISQAVSFILIKKASSTLSPRLITAVMLVFGAASMLVISYLFEPGAAVPQPPLVWMVFFSSAVIATSIGHLLFNAAIQKIGPGPSALFNNFVPFFALLGSYFLLGENIYSHQIFGFILIVTGVLFGTGYIESQVLKRKNAQRA